MTHDVLTPPVVRWRALVAPFSASLTEQAVTHDDDSRSVLATSVAAGRGVQFLMVRGGRVALDPPLAVVRYAFGPARVTAGDSDLVVATRSGSTLTVTAAPLAPGSYRWSRSRPVASYLTGRKNHKITKDGVTVATIEEPTHSRRLVREFLIEASPRLDPNVCLSMLLLFTHVTKQRLFGERADAL